MRMLLAAALLTVVGAGSAAADTIKTFDAQISLGGVNQYGFEANGTIAIDLTTETFVDINLGFQFIINFYDFTTITSQSNSAADISFTTVSSDPARPTLVIAIAKSTLGLDPTTYTGGPIDTSGTYFYFGPNDPGPGTPPANEKGILTFVSGSTVITPTTNVPEPATIGLLAASLVAGVVGSAFKRG